MYDHDKLQRNKCINYRPNQYRDEYIILLKNIYKMKNIKFQDKENWYYISKNASLGAK